MWLALLVSTEALAQNMATIRIGCSPSDTPTLEVVVSPPDRTFRVSVWGAGSTALQVRDVVLDGQPISEAHPNPSGSASVRPSNVVTPTWTDLKGAIIHFDVLEAKEGGAASGWIAPGGADDMKIPFAGTLEASGPCG